MGKPLSAKAYANFPAKARQRAPFVKMFTWIDDAGNRGSAKERLSVVA